MFTINFYPSEKMGNKSVLNAHEAYAHLLVYNCYITFEGKIISREYLQSYLIEDLKQKIAHGSGIDADWTFRFSGMDLIASNSYHAMDADGFYCGWIDFTATIEYGMKNGKLGVRSTDISCDSNMIELITDSYELDEDDSLYEDMSDQNGNAPYLDDLEEVLWQMIFDGNSLLLPII